MLAPYRKLIAYAVGAVLLLVHRAFGVDLGGAEDFLTEIVVLFGAVGFEALLMLVTGFFVWLFPNARQREP